MSALITIKTQSFNGKKCPKLKRQQNGRIMAPKSPVKSTIHCSPSVPLPTYSR